MGNGLKYIVIFTFIFVFTSCRGKEEDIPKGIIPKEDMVEIFTEIELTQALIKLKFSNQDTINQHQLFDQVYKYFDISEQQFNNSLAYYCGQPKVLEDIYVKVINNLSEKQAKIQ